MSEIHCRRPRRQKFEFSFVGNDRRPQQKSGTRREKRKALDSPDLSPSIPDDRGYLRFRVFISRQTLGQSGNSKIPDRLGFSRHMKTRLQLHDYNVKFQKRPRYTFYEGNVVHVVVHCFHCRSFFLRWPLAFLIFSPPLQIHVVLPTEKWLLISRSSSPSLFFQSSFSFSLSFSFFIFQICGRDN